MHIYDIKQTVIDYKHGDTCYDFPWVSEFVEHEKGQNMVIVTP